MRHAHSALLAGIFGLVFLATSSFAATTPVAAATLAAATTCSNGVANGGGEGLICEVTIANTITAIGGSATVTVRECHGAAGDPQAACTITVSNLTEPVTSVNQCNNSINGAGGTLRCSVVITNTYVAADPSPVAATVNQCVGSGDGFTVGCDPFPATTTGATITQCNGSANGGTLVQLVCTATGTQSDAFSVTINQCNGSGNGGGGLVICSSSIQSVNGVSLPTAAPTAVPSVVPTAAPTAVPSVVPTAAPTAVPSVVPAAVPTAVPTAGPGVGPSVAPAAGAGASQPVTDTASAPIAPTTPGSGLLALILISSALLVGMLALSRKQQA